MSCDLDQARLERSFTYLVEHYMPAGVTPPRPDPVAQSKRDKNPLVTAVADSSKAPRISARSALRRSIGIWSDEMPIPCHSCASISLKRFVRPQMNNENGLGPALSRR